MARNARSLADDLRSRDEEALVELLVRRPDLARPAPADLTNLAARATTTASVRRALEGLDLAHLQALEAVVVAGPATLAQLARLLDQPVRSRRVRDLVEDLCTLALCWRSPGGIRAVRTVQEVVGDPAGLGAKTDDCPTGAQLDRALAALDEREHAVLDALTWGPPIGVLAESEDPSPTASAGARLVERKLLHRVYRQHVLLPRQVALVLRGGRLHRQAVLQQPAPQTAHLDPDPVDAACGARAAELIAQVAEVLEAWGARPPRVLRGGGLAVRDLRRTASLIEAVPGYGAWLLEVMLTANLIAADTGQDPGWMPTGDFDDWAEKPAEQRWARLATAWLAMATDPTLVGQGGAGTVRVNVLSTQTTRPAARVHRRDALAALASLPAGAAPDVEDLAEVLRWRHPLRMTQLADTVTAQVLREAEWAGMTGRGALGTAARSLLEGDEEAAHQLMGPHMPPAVDHVLLQADLTAIAPGRLDGQARVVLRLLGEVESRGGASVHRITEAGIARALDLGWSADRVVAEIAAISRTGVPQPLDYLVRDVARRHGVARVGSVAAYLRSDDPGLLDRIVVDPSLGLLQLRRIAPTVVVSPVPAPTVVDLLREEQYGPVVEGHDGAVALPGRRLSRTNRRRAAPVHVSTIDTETAGRIVAAMQRSESARPRNAEHAGMVSDPPVLMELLRRAAAERLPIWVGYADDAGGLRRFLLRPDAVEGGRVRGSLDGEEHTRSLSVHRISQARLAE